ncbi:MAG: site-specific DNA-methyltransferase [Sedimentisphaerales bacterium]
MNMDQYTNKLIVGNNLKITTTWPSNYFDSIVTDPPYELGFMGKSWDSSGIAYSIPLWKQLLRVSKPGAFLLCFGGTRTYHRVVCAIEDAGWEIRDCMMWLYGSGFPKSLDISKAIDKANGVEKVVGKGRAGKTAMGQSSNWHKTNNPHEFNITEPNSALAQLWDGWGTALKPAWEPIIVAMKPLDGTFAHNAETHKVAGLNIDDSRIDYQGEIPNMGGRKNAKMGGEGYGFKIEGRPDEPNTQGRWPANLILDEEAGAILDEQTESASRFFYCAKASKKERNLGCEKLEEKQYSHDGRNKPIENAYQRNDSKASNNHPTVKPLTLMKYLCTLLKMPNPNQVILDPFMGSGTTGMACKSLGINFIGIDQSLEYCHIARKRIDATPAEEIK